MSTETLDSDTTTDSTIDQSWPNPELTREPTSELTPKLTQELESLIIQSLYTSSVLNQYPQQFLDLAVNYFKLQTSMILVADAANQNLKGIWTSGNKEGIEEHVESELYLDDPLIGAALSLPLNTFYASNITVPNWKSELSKQGLDWINNNQIHERAACCIPLKDNLVIGVFFQRNKNQGSFKQSELDFYTRFANHILRSMQAHEEMCQIKQSSLEGPAIINSLPLPTFIINESFNITLSNDKAEHWMKKTGLASIENGQLSLRDRKQKNKLALEVSRIIEELEKSPLENDTHGKVKSVSDSVFHWPVDNHVVTFVLRPMYRSNDQQSITKTVMCFIHHSEHSASVDIEALQTIFKLSKREAEISELLVRGFSLNEISEQLCLSIHSVRDALKRRIFKKCDVNSQNELISLLLSSAAAFTL